MALTQISTQGIKDGTITGTDLATNVDLVDNQKLRLGTGNDLEIYHSGSASIINNSTGVLIQRSDTGINLRSDALNLKKGDDSEFYLKCTANGAVELYHDNVLKLTTLSAGVQMANGSGNNTFSIFDSDKLSFGNNGDLKIFHDGNNSIITAGGAGDLQLISTFDDIEIKAADNIFIRPQGGEEGIKVMGDGAVELYHDNSKKFETTSAGATVTGSLGIGTTSPNARFVISDSSTFTAYGSSVPSIGDCMQSLSNVPTSEAVNNHATLQFGVNGGSHNRVNSISAVAESASNRKLAFAFCTDSGSNRNERMRLSADGNVGIGTTSPSRKLHLVGSNPMVLIEGSGGNGRQYALASSDDTTGAAVDGGNAGTFAIYDDTANAARLVINSSGNVGIGTTSPNNLLNIHGVFETNAFDNSNGQGGRFTAKGLLIGDAFTAGKTSSDDRNSIIWNERGLDLVFATNDTERMKIDSSGNVGIGTSTPSQTFTLKGFSKFEATNSTNGWVIGAHTDNSLLLNYNGAGNDEVVIDSIGRVFIGTTSGSERLKVQTTANTMVPMAINDSSNTATLTHRLMFQTGGTEVGRIRCTNSETQYNTSGSDISMKKNFESWNEDVLSLFKNINPQKFNFIQEEDGANKSKGFIAQEIANSFPEAYTKGEEEDDKYWFNPSGMVVYLMKAIQELEAEVASLKAS